MTEQEWAAWVRANLATLPQDIQRTSGAGHIAPEGFGLSTQQMAENQGGFSSAALSRLLPGVSLIGSSGPTEQGGPGVGVPGGFVIRNGEFGAMYGPDGRLIKTYKHNPDSFMMKAMRTIMPAVAIGAGGAAALGAGATGGSSAGAAASGGAGGGGSLGGAALGEFGTLTGSPALTGGGLASGVGSAIPASSFGALTGSPLLSSLGGWEALASSLGTTAGSGGGGLLDVIKGIGDKLGIAGGDLGKLATGLLGGSSGGGLLGGGGGIEDLARLAFLLSDFNKADGSADDAAQQLREAMQFQRDQIGRSAEMSDDLRGRIDTLLEKVNSGVMPSDQEVRDALAGVKGAYDGLGEMKMYGDADVEAKRKDIFDRRALGVDRAMSLASSQGFADTLRRGLDNSTQAMDTRDELVRKFADVYGNLDAQALADATGQVGQLAELQLGQRKGVLDEAMAGFNPAAWLDLYGKNVQGFIGNKQLDTGQLYNLLGALTRFNETAGRQADSLVGGASQFASAAQLAKGGAKERLFNGIFQTGNQPTSSGNTSGGSAGGWGSLVTSIGDLFGGSDSASGSNLTGNFDWMDNFNFA